MTLDSTGLGIGTDSPTRLLSLYSNSPTSVFQSFTNSSTGNTASDGAQIGIDSNNDLQIGQLESGKLIEFYNNGSLAMVIDSSQRVGIGTSSPSALLHLYKSGSTQAGLIETDQSASVFNFKSTGQTAGQPQIGCSGSNLILNTNGSERARILSSGGITFNGDTAAANALDDYEEGTHTVTLGLSTSGSITLDPTYQYARYQKVGNWVTVSGGLRVSSASSPVGVLLLYLPFTCLNSTGDSGRVTGAITLSKSAINVNSYGMVLFENQNYASIYDMDSPNGYGAVGTNLSGNEIINFSITYEVA
jgi:hypothetical protein